MTIASESPSQKHELAGHTDDKALYAENPASCDRTVDFIVPASLPADDKEFFEMMFTK
jgi:hypothetical protein